MSLLIEGARVVVGDGSAPLPVASVRVEGGFVEEVGAGLVPRPGERVLAAQGRVLLPGFVDAHTHALWAGDRLADFEQSLAGKTYPEIAAAGGGIWSTVRAVRKASEGELAELLSARLALMLREGTTSVEVKSGYGLDVENELKMLRAIALAQRSFEGTLVITALLGHALDPADSGFVRRTIEQTLPRVHEEFPDVAVDAYCEGGAWSVADCRALFERAAALGHPLRLHVDQFSRLGGLALVSELGLRSVDHLEASSEAELDTLAASACFGVMLPAASFHLAGPYANARRFVDAGGRLVLASNLNPGSAPCSSMPFVIALAVRRAGLSVAEAIVATTSRAASLLGLADRGRIEEGQRADLILLRHRDERLLAFEFGGNPVDHVIVGGRLL
ncbi:MAG: imidazolonepropionase [Polyangiaceae bacterium]